MTRNCFTPVLFVFLLLFVSTFSIAQENVAKSFNAEIVKPIPIDKATLSGIGLDPVTNKNEPDRKLFQRNLYRGPAISVYIVSSESASADHESYGIDEFIQLINGGARMNPATGGEYNFYTGDFFVAPMGYAGKWETRGATEYHHELSVITTRRNKAEENAFSTEPYALEPEKLSGLDMTRLESSVEEYSDVLFDGMELKIVAAAEEPRSKEISTPLPEQLIYVISGVLTLATSDHWKQTFYAGDYVLLPTNFVGTWTSDGHRLFRYLQVMKSDAF